MYLFYDRNTLNVQSIVHSNFMKNSNGFLKNKNIDVWNINKKFSLNPCFLKIKLDENKEPQGLYYRKKLIYQTSNEEKEQNRIKKNKEKKTSLLSSIPRELRTSLNYNVIKMWSKSPYSLPHISKSLDDFTYFQKEKTMPVSWCGFLLDPGGYGNVSRSIVFRLHNYHIVAKTETLPTPPRISTEGQYAVQKHNSMDFRRVKHYHNVLCSTPHPVTKKTNGKNVFYTMMETETLHPHFRDICNQYADEIWVPSTHNLNVFQKNGVKKPIFLMPLGIDESLYSLPVKRDINSFSFNDISGRKHQDGINKFRFFTLFGWSFRKGIDVLIKSFVKAFSDEDDVCLIIHSHHVGTNKIIEDVNRFSKGIRSSHFPQILFISGAIEEKDMPSLYNIGDAFLSFSRAEGFNLPPIEAAACGLPVIACNNTGTGEYLRDNNSFMITNTETEICNPEMHWISGFYHGQMFPKLGEEQIEQAVKHMHYVVNNYADAKIKAKRLKSLVYEKYTWEKATERVAKRLKEI